MARGRNSTVHGVRINDQLLAAVKSLAASQGLTTNEFIVQLVKHGLECSERRVEPKVPALGVVLSSPPAVSVRASPVAVTVKVNRVRKV